MKIKWAFVFLMMFIASVCFAETRDIGDIYQVSYSITDLNGNYITGQAPTLKIKKVSTGAYYDFSDDTFKTSGIVTPTTTLTEDTTGHIYAYTFTPPASETTAEQYIFVVDNADATYKDHRSASVTYQDIGTSTASTGAIADAVWDEQLSGHATTGSTGKKLNNVPQQVFVGN